jgi:hypothetical protein
MSVAPPARDKAGPVIESLPIVSGQILEETD